MVLTNFVYVLMNNCDDEEMNQKHSSSAENMHGVMYRTDHGAETDFTITQLELNKNTHTTQQHSYIESQTPCEPILKSTVALLFEP